MAAVGVLLCLDPWNTTPMGPQLAYLTWTHTWEVGGRDRVGGEHGYWEGTSYWVGTGLVATAAAAPKMPHFETPGLGVRSFLLGFGRTWSLWLQGGKGQFGAVTLLTSGPSLRKGP